MKEFNESDVLPGVATWAGRISCLKSELVDAPPEWMKRGLQETASGYGKRLNSGYKIHFGGKLRRIYVTIFSNSGTCWFKVKDRRITVDAH